jgi:hypothetical protein
MSRFVGFLTVFFIFSPIFLGFTAGYLYPNACHQEQDHLMLLSNWMMLSAFFCVACQLLTVVVLSFIIAGDGDYLMEHKRAITAFTVLNGGIILFWFGLGAFIFFIPVDHTQCYLQYGLAIVQQIGFFVQLQVCIAIIRKYAVFPVRLDE